MSRSLSAGYTSHLAQDVQQRAVLVKVTRQDAEVLAFTSFDDDLVFDGTTYEAEAAVDPSDVRSSVGTGVDNLEVMGALISERITDTDILAGLYDGAAVELFEVVWSDTALGRLVYLTGSLGEFTVETGRYRTELRSLSQRLAQQIVEVAQPTCRVKELFDARCFVGGENYDETFVPADFRSDHSVTAVGSLTEITFGSNSEVTGYYDHGKVTFLTGLNAGIAREVKSHVLVGSTAVITLQEAFPFTVAVGNSATLEAGCDRRVPTCRTRFANLGNYRGEPDLPGNNEITLKRGRR